MSVGLYNFLSSVILLSALAVVGLKMWYEWRTGVSSATCFGHEREIMLGKVPPEVSGVVYDMGSGWGNLVVRLARARRDMKITGIEISPVPFFASWLQKQFYGLKNLSLVRADYFSVGIADAGVILCYLNGPCMTGLVEKIRREAKPGTLIISRTFTFPGLSPIDEEALPGRFTDGLAKAVVYTYKVPESWS